MTGAAEDFGGDDEAPPLNENRPTVRPRTVRARQRRKEEAAARAAAVREALGGRRGTAEIPEVLPAETAELEPAQQELIALGEPPADPLAAQAWLHRAMVTAAREAILDVKITAADRRKELRNFAKVAAVLLPDARRFQAEEAIRRHLAGPAEAARTRGPELEAVPDELELDAEAQPG